MDSWHKDKEEASLRRATKRENKINNSTEAAKTKGAGEGHRKDESAKEESKRELVGCVARHVAD